MIKIHRIIFFFQVLRLVHYLVSFGFYYKSSDIKKLLGPLMELLDGRNDKPYPNITTKKGIQIDNSILVACTTSDLNSFRMNYVLELSIKCLIYYSYAKICFISLEVKMKLVYVAVDSVSINLSK